MKKIDKCRRLPIRLYDNPIGINLHEILQGSLPNRVLIVCSARAAPLGDTLKAAHVFETTVICNTNMDYVFSTEINRDPNVEIRTRRKVYVTRRIPEPGLNALKDGGCDVTVWDSDEAIPREKLIENVKGIDGLLCLLTDTIDGPVLDAAGPNLKVVSTMSVGYEHIDLKDCQKRQIYVCNTPNVSTDSVAELTVALLLLTARRLLEGVAAVKNGEWGKWKPMWLCGIELSQKTVGLLGLGRIGYGVARRLKPFGVKRILYNDVCQVAYADDIGAEFVDFTTMLRESDVICVCCNLTPQTHHKFNKEAFMLMKKSAILINSGRGGVIQHDDLYEALSSYKIAAAGLDVTEPEPLPADHRLVSLSNCIVLPHMGSNTWESRNSMAETAANNVLAVFENRQAIGLVQGYPSA